MTVDTMSLEYQRLRAPQENGQALQLPGLTSFAQHFRDNQSLLDSLDFSVAEFSLSELQSSARNELLDVAFEYSSRYRTVNRPDPTHRILMSGHQPQLFHPGVWYKNFMLARLSREENATAINLLVDNDLGSSTQIKVPTGSPSAPELKVIAYDRGRAAQPFEGRKINRPELWESFGTRVADAIQPLVKSPIIREFWPAVVENAHSMGPEYAIAAARHAMENTGDSQTLEVPLSRLCDTESFAQFASHFLADAERFRATYNGALTEYRELHRIRSQARPVPQLDVNDGFVEIPFWLWSRNQPSRQMAFVRRAGSEIELTNFNDVKLTLSANNLGQALVDANQKGFCLRPRALVTTMYARLVLSQMFVHGIGGSKYDQLNDLIIHRYFGVRPPAYFTFSSTHYLPMPGADVRAADLSTLKNQLRDLRFHPEQFLNANDSQWMEIRQAKLNLLSSIPERHQKSSWHQELEACNTSLQPAVESLRGELLSQQEQFEKQMEINNVLRSREFSFCLFPNSIVDELIALANQGTLS